jgi:cellulose synthase/poly-beta-1,6-N-acetylglucosamine synthase-like glycosyltransferase
MPENLESSVSKATIQHSGIVGGNPLLGQNIVRGESLAGRTTLGIQSLVPAEEVRAKTRWPELTSAQKLRPILETTRVLIGIPAHNEERNIGVTLDFIARKYPQHSILVVSGSTDETNRVTREMMRRYSNIDLIIERERRGKSSALGVLLKKLNEQYDVLIFMGADNLPEEGAIDKLLQKLGSDSKIGMVGGRPIPVNNPTKLGGWITHLLWSTHHAISLRAPKVSGELCALRAGIVSDIPPTIINDDAYLQFIVGFRGYQVSYEPGAIVYLRGPEKVQECFNQRYRVTIGHYQVEQLLGAKLPTTYARRNISLAWKGRKRVGFAKESCGFLFFLILSAAIVTKAWLDFYVRRKLPYKWKQIQGTKRI